MKREIDFYIDLPTDMLTDPQYLCATTTPAKLLRGYDRFRITIRLDNKYFESPVAGSIPVEEVKKIDHG